MSGTEQGFNKSQKIFAIENFNTIINLYNKIFSSDYV